MSDSPKPSLLKFILPLLIFVVAFGFRLMGLGWGLPTDLRHQSLHPDEEVIWLYSQQINPTQGDFTPGFYNYGTLYLTVLRVASDMTAVYGGVEKGAEWKFVGSCHRTGRIISALAGAGTALLVFFMLVRRTHWIGAVVGSSLVAFAPGFVVHSRFQTVDVLAAFLLTAAIFFAHRAMMLAERHRDWLWAGLMVGLSAGTKYTGILAVFVLFGFYLLANPRPPLKVALGSFGLVLLGFLVATPGALLEPAAFQRDLAYEMAHTAAGHGLVFERTSGFSSHIRNLIEGIGPLALLASLVCAAFLAKQKTWWPLLAFAVLHFLLIGRAEVAFLRYTLPLVPILGLAVGWVAGDLHEKGQPLHKAGVAVLMLCVGFSWRVAGMWTAQMAGEDPRDTFGRQWDRKTSVGLVSDPWFWSPSLFTESAISRMPKEGMPGALYGLQRMAFECGDKALRYVPENPNDRFDWDTRLITNLKPDVIVYSNFEVGPLARLSAYQDLEGTTRLFVDRFREFETTLWENGYEPQFPHTAKDNLSDAYALAYSTVEDMAYVRPVLYVWKKKP